MLNSNVQQKNKHTMRQMKKNKDYWKKHKKMPETKDRIGRFHPKILKTKIYFQFMICKNNFMRFEGLDGYYENLHILSQNRQY